MAIIPEDQFPGKITPASSAYPYGEARDVTTPGDGTGTPWRQTLVNDMFGWQQALLTEAGVTPDDTPDAATRSQYLQSSQVLHGRQFDTLTAALAKTADVLPVGTKVVTFANQNGGVVTQQWEVVGSGTGTVNGGNYIDTDDTTRQFKQIFWNHRVTPLHFGAKGDCDPYALLDAVNDNGRVDTAEIQAFLNAITYRINDFKFHYFTLAGHVFRVNDTLIYDQWWNITLDGESGGFYADQTFTPGEVILSKEYGGLGILTRHTKASNGELTGSDYTSVANKFKNITYWCQGVAGGGHHLGGTYLHNTIEGCNFYDYTAKALYDSSAFGHEAIIQGNNFRTSADIYTPGTSAIELYSADSFITGNVTRGGYYGAYLHNGSQQFSGNHLYGTLRCARFGGVGNVVTGNYFDTGVVLFDDFSLSTLSNNLFFSSALTTLKSNGLNGMVIVNPDSDEILAPTNCTCGPNIAFVFSSGAPSEIIKFFHITYSNIGVNQDAAERQNNRFFGNTLSPQVVHGDMPQQDTFGSQQISELWLGNVNPMRGQRITQDLFTRMNFNLRTDDKNLTPLKTDDALTSSFTLAISESQVALSHTFTAPETREDAVDTWLAQIAAAAVTDPAINTLANYRKLGTGDNAVLSIRKTDAATKFTVLSPVQLKEYPALPRTDAGGGVSDGGAIEYDNRFNYTGLYPYAFTFYSSNNTDSLEDNALPPSPVMYLWKNGDVQPTGNYRAADGTAGFTGTANSANIVVKNGIITSATSGTGGSGGAGVYDTLLTNHGYFETIYTANVSGALTIDLQNGSYQELTLTGNVTSITFANTVTDTATGITVKFIQDGTGGRTVSFGDLYAAGGTAPTLSTTAGASDTLAFNVKNVSDTVTAEVFVGGLDMQVVA